GRAGLHAVTWSLPYLGSKSGQGVEGAAAEARDGGFHGRVQDEQALLAVPPVTFQRAVTDSGLPQGRPETQEEEDEGENEDCEARYTSTPRSTCWSC
ncbi:hypothetical protein JG687_00014410, partial [Phytophthora cactorum]